MMISRGRGPTNTLYSKKVNAIVAKDIQTKTVSGASVTVMCDSTVVSSQCWGYMGPCLLILAQVTSNVGFKCWNGPFQLA